MPSCRCLFSARPFIYLPVCLFFCVCKVYRPVLQISQFCKSPTPANLPLLQIFTTSLNLAVLSRMLIVYRVSWIFTVNVAYFNRKLNVWFAISTLRWILKVHDECVKYKINLQYANWIFKCSLCKLKFEKKMNVLNNKNEIWLFKVFGKLSLFKNKIELPTNNPLGIFQR